MRKIKTGFTKTGFKERALRYIASRGRTSRRRGGLVIVYVALCLIVFLGATGLAVDVSQLLHNRAKAQRAADAAALAGAIQLALGRDKTAADNAARQVAAANGYDVTKNATFTSTYPVPGNSNWYQVHVMRPEPLFFMGVMGFKNRLVGAPATALYEQPANIDIYGVGSYGATGPMNLSLYGPYAEKQHGDAYSVKWHDTNSAKYVPGASFGDASSDYTPGGYNFFLEVPSNYKTINSDSPYPSRVMVELFDPDCYNNGGNDANGTQRVDEIRTSPHGNYTTATTTVYTLYYTNGTADPSDDIQIATSSYGNTSSSDMQWVTPSNSWTFDLNDSRWRDSAYDPTAFRINVRSTNGSSENGFLIRGGPPLPTVTSTRVRNRRTEYYYNGRWNSSEPDFDPNNGTRVIAQGRIPINFNQSGTVTVKLGYVPAGSSKVTIDKFDTDVGSKSITYSDGRKTYVGTLSANAQHLADVYNLPEGYQGGNWTATYTAGQQDTSSWSMYYSGPPNNQPGLVKLIR